ncbi:MAG: tRNA (adenosine(37)-N6)-threonylcarbamoyltransferase complex ATPase subunit type 1 TsaE [Actinomycetales bacterium]
MSTARAEVVAAGRVDVPTVEAMVGLGRVLAAALRPGDLLVLSGDLGAGKTTLTRGIGEGLGVRGAVTSPTFVIARVHPAPPGHPPLVHVDAYRLSSLAELDDLDLDAAQEDSVTVVEWGTGLAEDLAEARLELDLTRLKGTRGREPGSGAGEGRVVRWRAVGERWSGFALHGSDTATGNDKGAVAVAEPSAP